MYKNRTEAGHLLSQHLMHYVNRDAVVLAIPRGGVPLGKEIAEVLNLPMEVVLSKKIGYPGNKEYAIGAVSLASRVVNEAIEVSKQYIETETKKIRQLLQNRFDQYHQGKSPLSLSEKIVIIVDDGIATGYTMQSTIQLVAEQNPTKIVVAVPVASPRAIKEIEANTPVDEIICLESPDDFFAVGNFYADFSQVTDAEVIRILNEIRSASSKSG